MRRAIVALAVMSAATLTWASVAGASSDGPTCSEMMNIDVHAQHIVGDYVTGIGNQALGWPPNGQVGDTIGGSGGALLPGGPGPRFHWADGRRIAPGASFCVDSQGANGATNQQASDHVPPAH